ncbi:hypothetical protein ACFL2R_01660 [Patescibacteria group bacterium]
MNRVILSTDSGIILRQFCVEDVDAIFQLIDSNREHLSQFGEDTAKKYPDRDSVYRSVVYPKNSRRIRLGIWEASVIGLGNAMRGMGILDYL